MIQTLVKDFSILIEIMNSGCFLFNTLKYQVKTGPLIFKSFSAPTDQDDWQMTSLFEWFTNIGNIRSALQYFLAHLFGFC